MRACLHNEVQAKRRPHQRLARILQLSATGRKMWTTPRFRVAAGEQSGWSVLPVPTPQSG
jgi:hypothetical protein